MIFYFHHFYFICASSTDLICINFSRFIMFFSLLLYSLSLWPALRFSSFSIDSIASNSSVKLASIFPMSFSTETLECSDWLVSLMSVLWLAHGDVADDKFVGVLSAVVDFDSDTSSNGTFALECVIC